MIELLIDMFHRFWGLYFVILETTWAHQMSQVLNRLDSREFPRRTDLLRPAAESNAAVGSGHRCHLCRSASSSLPVGDTSCMVWWFGCHEFYFPIYWVSNHPNWLIFFRGVAQPPTSHVWYGLCVRSVLMAASLGCLKVTFAHGIAFRKYHQVTVEQYLFLNYDLDLSRYIHEAFPANCQGPPQISQVDLGHPGLDNAFLIDTGDPIAQCPTLRMEFDGIWIIFDQKNHGNLTIQTCEFNISIKKGEFSQKHGDWWWFNHQTKGIVFIKIGKFRVGDNRVSTQIAGPNMGQMTIGFYAQDGLSKLEDIARLSSGHGMSSALEATMTSLPWSNTGTSLQHVFPNWAMILYDFCNVYFLRGYGPTGGFHLSCPLGYQDHPVNLTLPQRFQQQINHWCLEGPGMVNPHTASS